jgi:GntR family transcriptional repressor for pyruvate dehydrogenase complex
MNVFRPIQHSRSAEEVAHQIEGLVLEGVLRAGDRLPGERELALETGVSRPIVREAIKRLEDLGILESRHGGGTYVADVIGTVFSPQISALLASHARATLDYLEYRREIEAVAARFAAMRATKADRELLTAAMERMEAAHEAADFEAEARADVEFHSLIGEMAHNLVLLHTLRSCYKLLSEGIFQNRSRLYQTPDGHSQLLAQHRAIHAAILAGDPAAAEAAARAHISHIIEATLELERRADRERLAGLRLARHEETGPRARARNG